MEKINKKRSTLVLIVGLIFIGLISLTGCSFVTNDKANSDTVGLVLKWKLILLL